MWFAIAGDLRFLSHHDLMRVMARAAARAGLPVKFTEGYNPRPKLSLALPRPVGVASRSELMVAEFAADVEGGELAAALGPQLPQGAHVLRCDPLPPGKPPRIVSADYEMPLEPGQAVAVAARLAELAGRKTWEVTRRAKARRGRTGESRTLDIKPSVRELRLADGALRFTIVMAPPGAGRCDELLALASLADAAEALAALTRTNLECEFRKQPTPGRNEES